MLATPMLSNTRTTSSTCDRASLMLAAASNTTPSKTAKLCGTNSSLADTVSSPLSSKAFFTTCSSLVSQMNCNQPQIPHFYANAGRLTELRFCFNLTKTKSFWRRCCQPNSLAGGEKLKQTEQNQTRIHNIIHYNTK